MPHLINGITLAVLAGGEGRRMGRPKAELRIDGQPILERLLDRLQWGGPTLLVTAPGRERPPGAERFDAEILDEVSGEGPLRGIMTALYGADQPMVVVVPLDMPNLSREPLEWMVRQLMNDGSAGSLMLRRDGEIEPLPVVFRIWLAQPIVLARLASGERSLHSLSEEPTTRVQPCPVGWPASFWTNLNTPEDLSLHA